MLPKSYNENNRCSECKHTFIEHDENYDNDYYCTFDKSKRPKSPIEGFNYASPTIYNRQYEAWKKWSDEHKVTECGTCDEWVEKKKET